MTRDALTVALPRETSTWSSRMTGGIHRPAGQVKPGHGRRRAASAQSRKPAASRSRNGRWSRLALKSPATTCCPSLLTSVDRMAASSCCHRRTLRGTGAFGCTPVTVTGQPSTGWMRARGAAAFRPGTGGRGARGQRAQSPVPCRPGARVEMAVRQQGAYAGIRQSVHHARGQFLHHEHVHPVPLNGPHDCGRIGRTSQSVQGENPQRQGTRRRHPAAAQAPGRSPRQSAWPEAAAMPAGLWPESRAAARATRMWPLRPPPRRRRPASPAAPAPRAWDRDLGARRRPPGPPAAEGPPR